MVSSALKSFAQGTKNAPITTRTRPDQVVNSTGGFVFTVDEKSRLERFLILGTDKGSYYVGERKLTEQNVDFLRKMIQSNERLVVDTIVDVSANGRAYRQSPALFALALVLSEGKDKAYAREAFNKVVRTSTHLFEMAEYVDSLGGWGRSKRTAFAGWYQDKSDVQLGYQMVKYRQRNGWSHRDVLRLSHAKPSAGLAKFALGKPFEIPEVPSVILGFDQIQHAQSAEDVLRALDDFSELPWETIPTQFLTDARVWKKLFYNGQLKGQALVRNITRLARIGAFNDLVFAADYAARLTDEEMIAKTKLHPINFLNASVVYTEGQVDRGTSGYYSYYGSNQRKKNWDTTGVISDALTDGFHLAFKHVESAGKRTLIGTDVSGSMGWTAANGLDLTAAQVSGAVAMTIARTEPYSMIRGFSHQFVDLGISAKTSLPEAMRRVQLANFGSTNISLPMVWARENNVDIDTFVVITDTEVNTGGHVHQELDKYRQKTGIPARLAVLGVSATDFTVARPDRNDEMDFVGFDAQAPRVLADFSAGRL